MRTNTIGLISKGRLVGQQWLVLQYNQGISPIIILHSYNLLTMLTHLLNTFNHYAFNHTTHIFISLLHRTQIYQLLIALESEGQYSQLAHLLRTNLFVTNLHQIDRSLYFIHMEHIPQSELIIERCNLISVRSEIHCLKNILMEKESLERHGRSMFGQGYDAIEQALVSPDLAMPPLLRETLAPHCKTVYQIIIACGKFKQYQERPQKDDAYLDQMRAEYFNCLLGLHVRSMHIYLNSITNPLQHFAQLTYRLMVYTNTILALQSICPLLDLQAAMQMWKKSLSSHYEMANKVFLEVGGFSDGQLCRQVGRITPELLIEQGYLRDYCEGLVDLSITSQTGYCQHQKHILRGSYSQLEDCLIISLKSQYRMVQYVSMQQKIQGWQSIGLRPSTILQLCRFLQLDIPTESDLFERFLSANCDQCQCFGSYSEQGQKECMM